MSSTELLEAASISITSSELARAMDWQDSHCPQGCVVGPCQHCRHAGSRERVACALVAGRIKLPTGRAGALPAIIGGAVLLRLIGGVGFANYDTLYALSWGAQLARGQAPAYEIPVAPTPHPLVEALGVLLEPFGPRAAAGVTVWLGLLALSACPWVGYACGRACFGRPPRAP